MEAISDLVRSTIPNYFSNLPIPKTFGGWFSLSAKDWVSLVPFFAMLGGISYTTYRTIKPKGVVNPSIKKNIPKVVDIVHIEDLGNKKVFCRCWRSKDFPYCDGTHAKHNEMECDNVGPLIVQSRGK